MGLAASQGRYLCLTARMSDLVYEGQQLSHQRLQLAKETQAVSNKYNDALNNTVMKCKTPGAENEQLLTYELITNQDPFNGLCMRIVDLEGNVVVPVEQKTINTISTDDEGNEVQKSFASKYDFIKNYMTNLTPEEIEEKNSLSMEELVEYYQANYPDSGVTVSVQTNVNQALRNQGEAFLFDENCTDPKYLQEMLSTGQWLLEQVSTEEEDGWASTLWQGSSIISEVFDTTDDAAAEAEYDAAMADIQKKDKAYELRIEQVQTEESAVEKEIESVKQVIGKNIENGFKTFA